MGPLSYVQSVVDRNVIMRCIPGRHYSSGNLVHPKYVVGPLLMP